MKIDKLSLNSYRNYHHIEVSLNPGLNIFYGENAQGKTNLLEAISFLSTLRSFRTSNEIDCIEFSQDFARIQCLLRESDGEKMCSVVITHKGKSLLVNQTRVLKTSEFLGLINTVLFSPSDLVFFEQAPKMRRKFLDIENSKLSKSYFNTLNIFNASLKERNIILKTFPLDETMLDIITQRLVKSQWLLVKARQELIDFINSRCQILYKSLSKKEMRLQVVYKTELEVCDQIDFEEQLLRKMKQSYQRDILLKITSVGCHRDDFTILCDGLELNSVASQGQKRLVLICMKLALLEFITFKTNKQPILLLDDVLSELDFEHQSRLINYLDKRIQVIITTTKLDHIIDSDRAMSLFRIENGQLVERRESNG